MLKLKGSGTRFSKLSLPCVVVSIYPVDEMDEVIGG